MDATCTIQDSIHVFSLVHKYVSRILGTYQSPTLLWVLFFRTFEIQIRRNKRYGDIIVEVVDQIR